MTTLLVENLYAPIHLPRRRMSEEGFAQFCLANPQLNVERDKYGNILIMAPVFTEGAKFESIAQGELYMWNRIDNTGIVYGSQAGFTLPNTAVRAPDAAWISNKRFNHLLPDQARGFAHICPDFVIEVRSRSDRMNVLKEKMEEYMENGCRLGFLIDPIQKQAFIYRPDQAVEVFSDFENDTLSGGDVLPGFSLPLHLFKPI